jgi:hypothetical protein
MIDGGDRSPGKVSGFTLTAECPEHIALDVYRLGSPGSRKQEYSFPCDRGRQFGPNPLHDGVSMDLQLRGNRMADAASDQQGVASCLVRQAAERSSSVASWLEARAPGSLLDEVVYFARRRRGTFLLMAAGAGLLAGG